MQHLIWYTVSSTQPPVGVKQFDQALYLGAISPSLRSSMASLSKPTVFVALLAMLAMAVIEPHFASAEESDTDPAGRHWRRPPPPPRRRPPPPPPRRRPPPPPPRRRPPPPPPRRRPPPPPPRTKPPPPPPDSKPPPPPPDSKPPPPPPDSKPPPPPPDSKPPPPPPDSKPPPPPPDSKPPPPPPDSKPPPPPPDSKPPPPPPDSKPPPPPTDCQKPGAVCGDPKIVGGDGVTFYFHGRMNQDFCLVSDSDLHINAHFIGKRPQGRPRDFTWVQALGFIFGHHALTIAAKRVAKWDNAVDQLQLSYNGEAFDIQGSSWASPDGVLTLNRIGATNAVDLTIKEKMGVALTIVPIGEKESKMHNYGVPDDDCFAHFDMQFRFYNLSLSVHGVLGQTYQTGYVNPTKRGVAMPIMGGADRFFSSSLLATDCKMSQYSGTAIPVGSAMPSFDAVCGSNAGSLSAGMPGGLICRR